MIFRQQLFEKLAVGGGIIISFCICWI